MGKLRLNINSTDVLGVYGIVNIVFNGSTLAASKQLSATVESLEYDVDILNSSNNILKIALLNDQAHDANNDGDYTGPEDQTLKAQVTALSYAADGVNFTTLLPQTATTYTIPSGPYAGNVISLTENVTVFNSYGSSDFDIIFNNDGLVNTATFKPNIGKILPNGNYQDYASGKTYDSYGNEV